LIPFGLCGKQEEKDQDRFAGDRDQKIKNLAQAFKQKQATELQALRTKIAAGHDEMEKARNKEFERLNNKFVSARRTLETSQLQEFNKFERGLKGSVSQSTMLNRSQYSTFVKSSATAKNLKK
jgi:hypothetical protein